MSSSENIRIVDIAKLAGVSAGTVDRVIHNRGYVSEEKRALVEKVLKEINYQPNLVARFLASKRNYKFGVVVPSFIEGDYWELVCKGISKAEKEMKKFNVNIEYFHFNQYSRESFLQAVTKCKSQILDGVLLATLFGDSVIALSSDLEEKEIPYVYIDSEISGQKNLAYFGSDSHGSGKIAAKLLLSEIGNNADIFIAHIYTDQSVMSVQIKNRELGFMEYLSENKYKGKIHLVEINPENPTSAIKKISQMLEDKDHMLGGIVLNSRIYELTSIIAQMEASSRKRIRLVGHDAIKHNIEALKNEKVSFILSQRPQLQGYNAIMALSNNIIFNQIPSKTNFMPIDILIKENIDYYT